MYRTCFVVFMDRVQVPTLEHKTRNTQLRTPVTRLLNGTSRHRNMSSNLFTWYNRKKRRQPTAPGPALLSARSGVPYSRVPGYSAIRYRLDGPGIESRRGQHFLHPCRPTLGPTQSSTSVPDGGKGARVWHSPLTPSSSAEDKEREELYPSPPHSTGFLVCSRDPRWGSTSKPTTPSS